MFDVSAEMHYYFYWHKNYSKGQRNVLEKYIGGGIFVSSYDSLCIRKQMLLFQTVRWARITSITELYNNENPIA